MLTLMLARQGFKENDVTSARAFRKKVTTMKACGTILPGVSSLIAILECLALLTLGYESMTSVKVTAPIEENPKTASPLPMLGYIQCAP